MQLGLPLPATAHRAPEEVGQGRPLANFGTNCISATRQGRRFVFAISIKSGLAIWGQKEYTLGTFSSITGWSIRLEQLSSTAIHKKFLPSNGSLSRMTLVRTKSKKWSPVTKIVTSSAPTTPVDACHGSYIADIPGLDPGI